MNKRIKKKLYKRFGRRTHSGYHAWWDKLNPYEKINACFRREYTKQVKIYFKTIPLVRMIKMATPNATTC